MSWHYTSATSHLIPVHEFCPANSSTTALYLAPLHIFSPIKIQFRLHPRSIYMFCSTCVPIATPVLPSNQATSTHQPDPFPSLSRLPTVP
ncbi:hypothetical protein Pmani_039374 [Petrolisthes manimaculis]|uniref:Uncharacterized protein n=1 Tax=Petrolisthes manimaculis TaxID=1843537 RepID=A0AAE1NEA3_9EUCA|nr:hypothetical protein Pmani_039374 [Petrolisthes manimaculis]